MMFETDFPHPTCQHPGPQTPAVEPKNYAESALVSLPDEVLAKVLVTNAAELYGVAV
jgi:predicted TIM-barrel fold metal-dependent hydrolase